jgi:signal transduction histidine kinase/CheY-like chemotaxis protein
MVRKVGIAGAVFLAVYAVVSIATGQRSVAFGDYAQLIPPIAYGMFTYWLARQSRGQVRVFWNLNAIHGLIWAAGQALWTYLDLFNSGGVPVITPTDPIFFASSLPLAAALYGRPERDRPRWLFDIVLLDLVLIALFAAFLYSYFIVTIVVTDGREDLYDVNLRQLLNARNLLLAGWAAWVWWTAGSAAWRRTLGIYALGLGLTFLGGVINDAIDATGGGAGGLADMIYMAPYFVMMLAAAASYDAKLFEPEEAAPALSRLPMVSLIAITLLVAIPMIDEVSRRVLDASDATAALRTRVALAVMIPFGIVVVVREFLSRRALIRAGQDLATTRQQLVQHEKLAAVGQLVSGVAHELNNPLQGVIGYAELMLASKPAVRETEELRAIRDNANRAAGIVRNLLTFAGRNTSARGWQQINRIVRDAIAVRQPQMQAAGIDLRLDAAERLPLVYVDHARLADVIVNLIHNAEAAIAARADGDGLPRELPDRGEIRVTTRMEPAPDRIFVEVADNGSGLKQEDLLRVFDPFFTTREVGQGTGLGLSVCYGIVREHGGQIVASHAPGGGAVFTIELPVMAESLVAATAAAGLPASAARPLAPAPVFTAAKVDDALDATPRQRKALVVDDEESNAALVRRVLASAGYDAESTTLSRRALVMIERTAYDAVVADVKMPELSGQELYGRVCQIRPEMARRFIFITGDIDGEDTREFLEQTRCSYFMKPFNLERLTAAVDMLTGGNSPDTIG